ncbi:hypothetical protein LPJ78_004972 [Coemansia sp. RSA 989]|nr:hypothetical protein LPJ78_004972 [Coemansia sp. RSA 989]KAJ1869205.1 hypothetical protein LPJ55_005518 [Coemansia sp. RSA 990]
MTEHTIHWKGAGIDTSTVIVKSYRNFDTIASVLGNEGVDVDGMEFRVDSKEELKAYTDTNMSILELLSDNNSPLELTIICGAPCLVFMDLAGMDVSEIKEYYGCYTIMEYMILYNFTHEYYIDINGQRIDIYFRGDQRYNPSNDPYLYELADGDIIRVVLKSNES